MNGYQLFTRMFERTIYPRPWLVVIALLASAVGCDTDAADNNATNTYVIIEELTPAGADGTVHSDVCLLNDAGTCAVANDDAEVTVAAFQKDITFPSGNINQVIFERYRVTYIRSDGRNVPGVDVPYPFDGSLNFSVAIDSNSTAAFTVVRHQAKVEPPLAQLARGGGSLVISVLAQVEFFGHDAAGRPITVAGQLNVTFADFPDDN